MIKRKKRKEYTGSEEQNKKEEFSGNPVCQKVPVFCQKSFRKSVFVRLWKRNKRAGKKSQSHDRSGLCPSSLFLWNGDNDTFYGCIQNSDGTLEQTVPECKGSWNVCVCGGRRRSRRNYAS